MSKKSEQILEPIHSHGHVGQVVIYEGVVVGDNPDLDNHPLARYPQPYAFTVVERRELSSGEICDYVLEDGKGIRILLPDYFYRIGAVHLFDANEYLAWMRMQQEARQAAQAATIEELRKRNALLEKVLRNQGVGMLTEEQAELLGLR